MHLLFILRKFNDRRRCILFWKFLAVEYYHFYNIIFLKSRSGVYMLCSFASTKNLSKLKALQPQKGHTWKWVFFLSNLQLMNVYIEEGFLSASNWDIENSLTIINEAIKTYKIHLCIYSTYLFTRYLYHSVRVNVIQELTNVRNVTIPVATQYWPNIMPNLHSL